MRILALNIFGYFLPIFESFQQNWIIFWSMWLKYVIILETGDIRQCRGRPQLSPGQCQWWVSVWPARGHAHPWHQVSNVHSLLTRTLDMFCCQEEQWWRSSRLCQDSRLCFCGHIVSLFWTRDEESGNIHWRQYQDITFLIIINTTIIPMEDSNWGVCGAGTKIIPWWWAKVGVKKMLQEQSRWRSSWWGSWGQRDEEVQQSSFFTEDSQAFSYKVDLQKCSGQWLWPGLWFPQAKETFLQRAERMSHTWPSLSEVTWPWQEVTEVQSQDQSGQWHVDGAVWGEVGGEETQCSVRDVRHTDHGQETQHCLHWPVARQRGHGGAGEETKWSWQQAGQWEETLQCDCSPWVVCWSAQWPCWQQYHHCGQSGWDQQQQQKWWVGICSYC